MTSNDGMDWAGAATALQPNDHIAALEAVGTAAKLSVFNAVRATFDRLQGEKKITRRHLAERLGTSPQAISRLLVKPSNMTVETAARLLFVMGRELRVLAADPAPASAAAALQPIRVSTVVFAAVEDSSEVVEAREDASFASWVKRACESMEKGKEWGSVSAANNNWAEVIDEPCLHDSKEDRLEPVAA